MVRRAVHTEVRLGVGVVVRVDDGDEIAIAVAFGRTLDPVRILEVARGPTRRLVGLAERRVARAGRCAGKSARSFVAEVAASEVWPGGLAAGWRCGAYACFRRVRPAARSSASRCCCAGRKCQQARRGNHSRMNHATTAKSHGDAPPALRSTLLPTSGGLPMAPPMTTRPGSSDAGADRKRGSSCTAGYIVERSMTLGSNANPERVRRFPARRAAKQGSRRSPNHRGTSAGFVPKGYGNNAEPRRIAAARSPDDPVPCSRRSSPRCTRRTRRWCASGTTR